MKAVCVACTCMVLLWVVSGYAEGPPEDANYNEAQRFLQRNGYLPCAQFDIHNRETIFGQKQPTLVENLQYMENSNMDLRVRKTVDIVEHGFNKRRESFESDFLVNDDVTGSCDHTAASVATDPAGNFVICWQDYRNDDKGDILAQRFDVAGNPQDSVIRVNDDVTYTWRYRPVVAMDDYGNFVITWFDYRNGDYDIWVQRYDAAGNPLGANLIVNDDAGRYQQQNPRIAMNLSGDFVICWEDGRDGGYIPDIYAQRYDAAGSPLGANFKVNDDVGTYEQYYPAAVMDTSGNFLITWYDNRNGGGSWNPDIYAQRYDAAGNPLGVNFRVDDDAGTSSQYAPTVAMDISGNFVITWSDCRAGGWNSDIYAQMFDAVSNPVGANFKVNDDTGTLYQERPKIAMDPDGNFVITWSDYRNNNYDIYAQRYDAAGSPQGANFKVNDDLGTANNSSPCVALDSSGNFAICWDDDRCGNADIYVQSYHANGSPQNPNNYNVTYSVGTSDQWYPSVAINPTGNFVMAWADYRNGDADDYAQLYDAAGNPLGTNFRINDDAGTATQFTPAVAMDFAGNFVITWTDYRAGAWNTDIYAQMYDAAGSPLGRNFKVNDDAGTNHQLPSVAMDSLGNFVITWTDDRDGDYSTDIYAQRYDAAGNPLGANFRVEDDPGIHTQWYTVVAMNPAGDFVIAWCDCRSRYADIYAQMYDAAGSPLGVNFRVNDDTSGYHTVPSTAMDNAGNFVISWELYTANEEIYAKMYDAAGNPQGANFKVNDDVGIAKQDLPSVAIDPLGGRFAITWADYRNPDQDPELFAQLYENGNPVGTNVQINDEDLFPYNHQLSWRGALACNHDTLAFVWQDNRRHKGWDIYGKLIPWTFFGIQEETQHDVSCLGLRAYPNPFCKYITIAGANNELIIYDVTGRLIGTTKLGVWDGKDKNGKEVESGIYFLRNGSGSDCKTLKIIKLK